MEFYLECKQKGLMINLFGRYLLSTFFMGGILLDAESLLVLKTKSQLFF